MQLVLHAQHLHEIRRAQLQQEVAVHRGFADLEPGHSAGLSSGLLRATATPVAGATSTSTSACVAASAVCASSASDPAKTTPLGFVPQVARTRGYLREAYGMINDAQVVIGESTASRSGAAGAIGLSAAAPRVSGSLTGE